MNKKLSPFKLNHYSSRSERVDNLSKPDNIFGKEIVGHMAVAIFVCIDFFCMKSVWNSVQTEDAIFIICLAVACAIALDLPLAIAAYALKKYMQGLSSKKERNLIVILSITVFIITFVFSLGFKIITKDQSFDIKSSSNMTDTMEVTVQTEEKGISEETDSETGTESILFAAAFCGIIPLLTSISSFVISFWGFDPLGKRISKLEKNRIGLQANIHEAEKALAEMSTSEEYCQELIAREEDLYKEFLSQLDADALALKQMVRILIMKKLETPENVAAMSKDSKEMIQSYDMNIIPGQGLPEFIEDRLNNNEKVIMAFNSPAA